MGTIGAIADAVAGAEKIADDIFDANKSAKEQKAGADAVTVKGQTDALEALQKDKQVETAMLDATGNPDAKWADGVRKRYERTD